MKKIIPILILLLIVLFNPYISKISADSFPSNCIINKIGSPAGNAPGCAGSSSSGAPTLANIANDLVIAAKTYCGGQITNDNYTCMQDHIPTSVPADNAVQTFQEIRTSVNYSYYFQCVGFANAVSAGAYGQSVSVLSAANGKSVGIAADFINDSFPGYRWDAKTDPIQEGDIPVFAQTGPYSAAGHITVVTNKLDDNDVILGQANGQDIGDVSFRNETVDDPYLAGWLRKQ